MLVDIERMYGKRKAIAKRTPLFPSDPNSKENSPKESSKIPFILPPQSTGYITSPAVTEGDTTTDTELETETEIEELLHTTVKTDRFSNMKLTKLSRHLSIETIKSVNKHVEHASIGNRNASVRPRSTKMGTPQRRNFLSEHDLLNKYFRRDTVVLRHMDLLR